MSLRDLSLRRFEQQRLCNVEPKERGNKLFLLFSGQYRWGTLISQTDSVRTSTCKSFCRRRRRSLMSLSFQLTRVSDLPGEALLVVLF